MDGGTSAEGVVRRAREQLTNNIAGLVIDGDMEKTEEERINMSFKFVQSRKGLINGLVSKKIVSQRMPWVAVSCAAPNAQ